MDMLQGIKGRRSCRAFKPDPVPQEKIQKVLEAANNSPSYTNSQPWEVAVVSGQKRDELSNILVQIAESNIPPAPDIPYPKTWPLEIEKRTSEHGARRFAALGIERANEQQRKESRLANFRFYGAPAAMFLFMDTGLTPWSIFDMGLFAQSILLAAHGEGLSTCLQAVLASYPDTVRNFLGIDKAKTLLIGISIGYCDTGAKANSYQSTRRNQNDFTKWYP